MSNVKLRARRRDVARILETFDPDLRLSRRPSLIVAIGLPGSGKSTFCRALAREIGAALLESDSLRRTLFGQPSHSQEESTRLFATIYEAARLLLHDGASVIIDATNLRERDREPAYRLSTLIGARLILLHFSAPEGVIMERLSRRGSGEDPEDRSTAGPDVYRRMEETQQPLLRDHVRVDTANPVATRAAHDAVVRAVLADAD